MIIDNFGNELEQCVNDKRLNFNVYSLMICMQVKEYNIIMAYVVS